MAKELYLYSPLYSFSAEIANRELSTISENEELIFRINSPGGEVNAGFSILSKLQERKSKTKAIIDGQAKSMAAYMLPFFDHVIANDTSEIMFHKAAYPDWYKPTKEEIEALEKVNKIFKEKITAKVKNREGAKEFLNKLFEKDVRNDVNLTPKEAKKLNIVQEVRKIQPKAFYNNQLVALIEEKQTKNTPSFGDNNNSKSKSMTKDELKANHPALYNEIVQEGVSLERDRVEAWAVYNDVNPVKVKEGIESGKSLSQKAMAEFAKEAMAGEKIKATEEENVPEIKTEKEIKTGEQAEALETTEQLDKLFGKSKNK